MKFILPEQNAATADSSPSNPRKLKKVLSALPNANMGELTRQTFQILRDQNRQLMPNKHRLENLEMLREQTRNIFNNLKKYFINRTLPLPDKSQKIVNLNQSILRELTIGYKIIAYEAANSIDINIDDKTLSIAICRAIKYLSEIFLRSSEVYAPRPKNMWLDIHQLYTLAERKNLTANIIIDEENKQVKTTIENSYKQILLFALARPITLRQSDNERVFKKLYEWSQYASIHYDASEKLIDHVFCMRVNEDSAPDYLSKNDLADNVSIRVLDVDKLVSHIETIITQQNQQELAIGDTIPVETLKVLVNTWVENAKRRFSRADRHDHINVAIGLKPAVQTISASLQKNEKVDKKPVFVRTSASMKQDPDFALQSIVTDADKREQGYITHTEIADEENDAWGMVAKGRVLTDTYVDEKKRINEEPLNLSRRKSDSHWVIVNISAGGYCLRWNSDETSQAQIGELIALQEFDSKNNFEWRIGVIRWMQFTQKDGLEIGVQAIAPKVIAVATARRFNKPDEEPFDCLILPGIKALKQASSILLPAHAFKTNDKLVVQLVESKLNITLGPTKEHTGSFTQFSYENATEEQLIKTNAKKKEATKNIDDFDELWSSL
ncbi:MAG: hypothetical protein ACNYZG_01710 [Gammaproteobacteria bacterium]